jgi:hypothetical protein
LGLLKILSQVLKTHSHPQLLILTYDIVGRVEPMVEDESVLVADLARKLMREMQQMGGI